MSMQLARYNMVDQQIKPLGVLDERILNAFLSCPREQFVPAAYQNVAYADTALPLGNGRMLLAPNVIGRMLQALALNGSEDILEIGAGTGYITALLAKLGRHVTSIENSKPLVMQANTKLAALALTNYEIITGTATKVLQGNKGFDVIVLTGSVPYLPKVFSSHAKRGGRLFAVLGHAPAMYACIFTRINEEEWSQVRLFETVIQPLKEIADVATFEF